MIITVLVDENSTQNIFILFEDHDASFRYLIFPDLCIHSIYRAIIEIRSTSIRCDQIELFVKGIDYSDTSFFSQIPLTREIEDYFTLINVIFINPTSRMYFHLIYFLINSIVTNVRINNQGKFFSF